jgi:hypothetical protein
MAPNSVVPLWLIDREVGTTLKRAWHSVGFWQRFGLLGGLLASVFERETIDEKEIEKLKQGDLLESAFSEFASESQPLYRSLIAERDAFMAARLREEAGSSIDRQPVPRAGGDRRRTPQRLSENLREQQGDAADTAAELARHPTQGALAEMAGCRPGAAGVRGDCLRLSSQHRAGRAQALRDGCCSPVALPRSARWPQALIL